MPELGGKRHLRDNGTLFTAAERAHCRSRPDPDASLTGLFSAKEAFVKALCALEDAGDAPAYAFPQVEVVHGPAGQPRLRLHGDLAAWCAERDVSVSVSISHTGSTAGAVVVLQARATTGGGRCP
ncbi:holo-ACP synthase [Streptomyces sp. DH41]|uniref:holo-ACP synthase n=1 Tax=Streptomyces sp. DH41 TaxID=3040125 RepID=UPI002442E84A|nr:holo-ACP synthase [Streptomyces sp. DH41]MDG9722596.1 holo-ACP synthase [Streptomyces sp. DH41]